jgi:hypothetical protein
MKCWYPNADHVNIIYHGTPEGSPGRRFLVDLYVVLGTKESINHELEAEFAVDVAKAFYDQLHPLGTSFEDFSFMPLKAEDYFWSAVDQHGKPSLISWLMLGLFWHGMQ